MVKSICRPPRMEEEASNCIRRSSQSDSKAAMAAAVSWPAIASRLAPRKMLVHDEVSRHVVGIPHRNAALAARGGRTVAAASKGAKEAANGRDNKSSQGSSAKEADNIWTSRAGWACVKGCGACCVLDKGPTYPPIEEVLTDAAEAALYRSMVGPDGWCINYDKISRSCTIHNERPRFCRVEPATFKALYGIEEKDMDKEACGFCQDQIRSVYGGRSKELKTFQRVVRNLKKT